MAWFEALLEEEDVDILGWALGTLTVPEEFAGPLMERMCRLDYVEIPR
ncbi:succinate dehydrogenase assembly factor 2 [Acinetobacter baumannii]